MLLEDAGDLTEPMFSIAAVAARAGLHQQTIRAWEREGLLVPSRTRGRTRRYSRLDLVQLAEIRRLSEDGVSIEGIRRILVLQREVALLRATLAATALSV